jgi:hypothetical protein
VDGFDWAAAAALAAEGTRLLPGDLLAAPSSGDVQGISPGSIVVLTPMCCQHLETSAASRLSSTDPSLADAQPFASATCLDAAMSLCWPLFVL